MAKLLLASCLAWAGLNGASGMRMVKRRLQNEGRGIEASSVEDSEVEDRVLSVLEDQWVPEEENWPVLEEVEDLNIEDVEVEDEDHAESEGDSSIEDLEVESEEDSSLEDLEVEDLPEEEDWPVLEEEAEDSETRAGSRGRPVLTCPYKSGRGAVSWGAFGGVNKGKGPMKVKSRAKAGDHEFVAIGGSKGGSKKNLAKPWNKKIMTKEGFKLVVIQGPDDKKASLWYRKSKGGGNVYIPGKANDNPYTIFTVKGNLKMNSVKTKSVKKQGKKEAELKRPSGSGLTIGVFFFDDPFKLPKAPNGGDILCTNWGYGDGDGFAVVLYQPGKKPPGKFKITRMESGGGSQYVSLTAVIPVR